MRDTPIMLEKFGVVPVITMPGADDAEGLADALIEGDLPLAEITFRTDGALEALKRMKAYRPSMLLGAGTILTAKQAEEAIKAKADFIVSPAYDDEVVDYCLKAGVPVYPGCANPSEFARAYVKGLRKVKFFPAEALGGLPSLRAMAAPFPGMRFMPTGGISLKNLGSYLSSPLVFACGGSFIAPRELIEKKDFDEIKERAHKARAAAISARGGSL
jgi:2-dehydro-3-deoxyphosphogluconate aldolase/(4S)-4-hydroxy-2-oxoglutarate aldolase